MPGAVTAPLVSPQGLLLPSYDPLASIDAPEVFWFRCQLDGTDDGYRRSITVVQVQLLVILLSELPGRTRIKVEIM
jgi:hypothetical protein